MFRISPEEASSNHVAFLERQEPTQDRSRRAADRGLRTYPFGDCSHITHGDTKQLKMACSTAKWLPTLTASAGQAVLSYPTFNSKEKLISLHASPAKGAGTSFRLSDRGRAEVESLL